MPNCKVLFDPSGSGFIRVVGKGDYVHWPMWNEKLQECEALRGERDALLEKLAQKEQLISEMDQLCLTVAEVNEIRAEAVSDFAKELVDRAEYPKKKSQKAEYYKTAIAHAYCFAKQYAEKLRQEGYI